MPMKINGITGTFPVANVNKRAYKYTRFSLTMSGTADGGVTTVDVKTVLENAWAGVVKRSKAKACNDCFKLLVRKKTLAEILAEGDLILHCLEPKDGYTGADLPKANTAGRDIGLDPALLFDPLDLVCTLIHELAHVGGATTNSDAPKEEAHAAEKTLLSCSCTKQYQEDVLGRVRQTRPGIRYV